MREMNDDTKKGIELEVIENLKSALGEDVASDIVRNENADGKRFIDEVIEDVMETSAWEDEGYFNNDDVKLSTGRILADLIWKPGER